MGELSGCRILVVDDDPDTLTYFRTVLEDGGATVLTVVDGNEVLRVARRERPDLITLDMVLPGKDGSQVFEDLRRDPILESIPVCIITARPELRRLIYQGSVRRPEGYLDKPVDGNRLFRYIKRLVGLSRRHNASVTLGI